MRECEHACWKTVNTLYGVGQYKSQIILCSGKPKGSQTELENEIAGNDNDFYWVFIASFPWFADNK